MVDILSYHGFLRGRGLAERTTGEYVKFARRWLRYCHEHGLDAETADTGHVRAFADTLPGSWASRKQAKSALRHWFTHCGRVSDTPWTAVRVPRKPKPKYRGLENDQAGTLRDAALMIGGRRGLAVLIGLYTGARASEIAALRWDGVSQDSIRWWRSKTSEWHEVPLHPVLAEALDNARPTVAEGCVFAGDKGRPHVSGQTVWEWVVSVSELAGLPRVTPHQLRSTAGTTVLEATRDLDAAAEFLGHSDPSVTRTFYTRTSRRRMDAAVASLTY